MRVLVQAAYVLRRRIFALFRVRTRGVKIMLFNDAGELLLIRNSYGNRKLFVLPGGGVGRREAPESAAAREVREELSVEAHDLTLIGTYESGAEGKRDTIHLFRAMARGNIHLDLIEVEEARFFPLDDLPETLSPATRRRIQEGQGEIPTDGHW